MQRDVALALSATPSLREGLGVCITLLTELDEIDCGGLYLVNADNEVDLAAHVGLSASFIDRVAHLPARAPQTAAVLEGTPCYYTPEEPIAGPAEAEALLAEGIRLVAAIPVVHEGRVIACLNLASRSCDELPQIVRQFLESVVAQITGAVARLTAQQALRQSERRLRKRSERLANQNQTLRSEIEERIRAQETVRLQRDIAILFTEADSLEDALERTAAEIVTIAEVDCASIYLLDKQGHIREAAHAGLGDDFIEEFHALGPFPARMMAATGGTPRYYHRSRAIFGSRGESLLRSANLETIATIPICKNGRVLAGLTVASRSAEQLPERVRNALESVAAIIGTALVKLEADELLRIQRQAIEASLSGVAMCDANGELIYVNRAFLRLWGYDHERECLGRPVVDFWADQEEAHAAAERTRRRGAAIGEMTALRKDGRHVEMQLVAASVYADDGHFLAMMASFLDVSWQRRLDRLQTEVERLSIEGRMAARIAHEINNPLAGITNCFQLIRQAIPDGHPSIRFADMVESELERVGRIVKHMYELSKSGDRGMVAVLSRDVIEEVITMLAPAAGAKEVRVLSACPKQGFPEGDSAEPPIRLPSGLLHQVLYNVISNAIEASPRCGVVKIGVDRTEDCLWVMVEDDGPGIPEEERSKLCEPFYTTKAEATNQGLGLGLAITKTLLDSVGGTIRFDSGSAGGTMVVIMLADRDDTVEAA